VINVTMPDDKANYLHRIGRVGRADCMGLAISLVAKQREKVWYHSNCRTRGNGCFNTNDIKHGGCTIWYNEMALLGEVEDHLKGKNHDLYFNPCFGVMLSKLSKLKRFF